MIDGNERISFDKDTISAVAVKTNGCCAKCKREAVIFKIELREYSSIRNPPCFYFHLKCLRCKMKGQRKVYLNYGIDEILKIKKEEENGR